MNSLIFSNAFMGFIYMLHYSNDWCLLEFRLCSRCQFAKYLRYRKHNETFPVYSLPVRIDC